MNSKAEFNPATVVEPVSDISSPRTVYKNKIKSQIYRTSKYINKTWSEVSAYKLHRHNLHKKKDLEKPLNFQNGDQKRGPSH